MEERQISKTNIFYPPGGLLIWIVVLLELFTFGIGLVLMTYLERQEPSVFFESRRILNSSLATLNTIILLSSGYFMAIGVSFAKKINLNKASNNFVIATILGIAFLVIKAVEYFQKFNLEIFPETNTFFTFYFLLTAFHAIHVLFGIGLFTFIITKLKIGKYKLEDIEASAIFWHMCDLIWLLLFPLIYLK